MSSDIWSIGAPPFLREKVSTLQRLNHIVDRSILFLSNNFETEFFDAIPWSQEFGLDGSYRFCNYLLRIFIRLATMHMPLEVFLKHFDLSRNDATQPLLFAGLEQSTKLALDVRRRHIIDIDDLSGE